jgi:hypothetical protein
METYIFKLGGFGISFLSEQLFNNTANFDYLDPVTSMIKIGLLRYKKIGTKLGIYNHIVKIQDVGFYQSIQRFMNSDDRTELYKLRWPILYFHGMILGYIEGISEDDKIFLNYVEEQAICGLKRLRSTYDDVNGSIIANCIDNYIDILTSHYSDEDFRKQCENILTSTVMNTYSEYMKKWNHDDLKIIEQLFNSIDKKIDKKTQNSLCSTIEAYLDAKDIEIATIRPN